MNKLEKELVKLVKVIGQGNDIATLSAKSAELDEFDFFEAHEICDMARDSKHFRYDEETQNVYLADSVTDGKFPKMNIKHSEVNKLFVKQSMKTYPEDDQRY